ncbi:MAG: HAMP domain-containing protein [Anaerolineae bacterium]|nr:HAMP domain-containing protein [Anaerolineae bacterium]
MRSSLFWKLMAVFAVIILIGIGGALLLAGRTTEVEFRRYARASDDAGRWEETAADLAGYYAAHGSWDGVAALLRRGQGHGAGTGPPLRLADTAGHIVADQTGAGVGQTASAGELEAGLPILVDGERVGTLLTPGGEWLTVEQESFLERMRVTLMVSGGAALVVALVLGALLVRSITRPLQQLTEASRTIAAGDLDTRVSVRSRDEVGQLADAFNFMAADLARAEKARRNQTADVAHELRTPLTVIQGALEAMLDGVYPPDRENLQAALAQTRTLSRLVEDLRLLALADAGQLRLHTSPLDLVPFLREMVETHQIQAQERGVDLALETPASLPLVEADRDRLAQVMGNLLSNALRYVPEGGHVTVRAMEQNQEIVVAVADDGPGIPPEDLPHLFERFWRGDRARRRATGGSGLGLSIARELARAHGGRLWAESVEGEGSMFAFALPVLVEA